MYTTWHTTSFFGQKYINHRLKGWVIKDEKGGQTRTKKEFKKGMKVIPVTRPSFHPTCKDAPLQRVRGQPAEGQGV